MQADEDKKIEKLVDRIMKDAVIESPSIDFTSKVMSKALASKTSDVMVYKPLISRSVFIAIFGCIVLLFIYLSMNGEKQENAWFSQIKFGSAYNSGLISFFKVSKVMLYAVVSTTVMLLVQVSFLKNYFDKQFEK